ncbi:MAG: hypothetical protein Q4C20_08725 [Erysipelotrichaceae bacterium]|nr:hypothetical protein [Erysipelotrichaceae bacterium]
MITTLILSLILMAGLFLMLWAGVAFIQDPKYFSSAPKEVRDAILPKAERFKGAHALGWLLAVISILMMAGAVIYGMYDGIRNRFTFMQLFIRFVLMLLSLKAFDILFFDLYLLCNSDFFSHYYPEVKAHLGMHLFGFNAKEHAVMILLCPLIALVLALICSLLIR